MLERLIAVVASKAKEEKQVELHKGQVQFIPKALEYDGSWIRIITVILVNPDIKKAVEERIIDEKLFDNNNNNHKKKK